MKVLTHRTQLILLGILAVLLVFNPYYLHQQINLFELGLYLPGIDGILHGQVPFRDFFYLRGPFEVYLPALLMKIFGENIAVLCTYFYVGSVLTLLAAILIAGEVFETKIFWWIFTPVMVARTFPRVVFTYWGGMRYVWGLLAVYCAVRFLKTRKIGWMIGAGLLSAVGGLSSIEIGLSTMLATLVVIFLEGIYARKILEALRSIGVFLLSVLAVILPYCWYLNMQGGWGPMLEVMAQIATSMTKVFLVLPAPPSNVPEFLAAMFNSHNHNFQYCTPAYCFILFLIYLIWRMRLKKADLLDWSVSVVFIYAVLIYVTGLRNIQASVFEMSLQPEKIVLFFLIGKTFLFLKERGLKYAGYALIAVVVVSSLIFSFSHMNKRFFSMQWLTKSFSHKGSKKIIPLSDQKTQLLSMDKVKGMTVPQGQADDFTQLKDFLDKNTASNEPVLMFAELATLNFVVDRPYVGRFACVSLSWIKDSWYQELMEEVKHVRPKIVVMNRKFPDYFKNYFLVKANQQKFDEMFAYVQEHYVVVAQTPSYNIYQRIK